MILVRSPLRITLGGGGTDFPAYYTQHGGMWVTAAIDKYVYVSVLKPFVKGLYIKHRGASEECAQISDIQHPLIREAIRAWAPPGWEPQLEVTTLADVPAGTGLGSSSACACALTSALGLHFQNQQHAAPAIAERACVLEMDLLHESVGKQDAYASAYGDMRAFTITTSGEVTASPAIDWRIQQQLEGRLQLYFTGLSRSASGLLTQVAAGDHNENLQDIHALGILSLQSIQKARLWKLGEIFSEQWRLKCQRSSATTNAHIDELYRLGMTAGATGGKLVGAGGGGFLLFHTPDPARLRKGMAASGAEELPFRFADGIEVVCQ